MAWMFDLFLGLALLAQRLKRAELVERMERRAVDVLGKRVFLRRNVDARVAHDAGHRRGLGEALLFDEKLERAIASRIGRT